MRCGLKVALLSRDASSAPRSRTTEGCRAPLLASGRRRGLLLLLLAVRTSIVDAITWREKPNQPTNQQTNTPTNTPTSMLPNILFKMDWMRPLLLLQASAFLPGRQSHTAVARTNCPGPLRCALLSRAGRLPCSLHESMSWRKPYLKLILTLRRYHCTERERPDAYATWMASRRPKWTPATSCLGENCKGFVQPTRLRFSVRLGASSFGRELHATSVWCRAWSGQVRFPPNAQLRRRSQYTQKDTVSTRTSKLAYVEVSGRVFERVDPESWSTTWRRE